MEGWMEGRKREGRRKEGRKMEERNRLESVNGHQFPMPHFSRRGDERVEMGHRPQKG
jgi:hypothetical protein